MQRIQETLKSDAVRPVGGIGFVLPGMLRPRGRRRQAAQTARLRRAARRPHSSKPISSSRRHCERQVRVDRVKQHADRRRGDEADAVGRGDDAGDAALFGQRDGEADAPPVKPGRVKPKPRRGQREAEDDPVKVVGDHRSGRPAAAISAPHRISARGLRPSRGIRPHCAASVADGAGHHHDRDRRFGPVRREAAAGR